MGWFVRAPPCAQPTSVQALKLLTVPDPFDHVTCRISEAATTILSFMPNYNIYLLKHFNFELTYWYVPK